MFKRIFLIILLAVSCHFLNAGPRLEYDQTALDQYVHQPDQAYRYEVVNTLSGEGYTTFIVNLISQKYLTSEDVNKTEWQHWLIVVKPDEIKHQTGMLIIGAGDNDGKIPDESPQLLVNYAKATGSIVAELSMVPNQPLTFKGEKEPRWEDAIIAYTWDKYLKTGEERWPARMAMTKSAVAAMDAIQSLMEQQDISETVSKFVIAGASKRGWTTWTTGAVDDRVEAMIPIVIDLLNLEPSFKHHWSVYGFWAPAIQDYVDMEIVDWWYSPEIRSLFNLVGPFSYKDRFQMPKLLVNAAGDEFFIPTSSQFYFDELPGEKYLRYVPNADHGLSDTDALETVLAFYASILNNFPRPQFSWKFNQDGSIRVTSEGEVKEVNMWSAKNPEARDFRKDKIGNSWRSTVLIEEQDGSYKAMPETPHKGWRAYFVELTYETPFGIPLKFTTPVRVIPDTLPYQHKPPKEPKKGFLTK